MRVFVGTSGYSYAPWKGPFYPEDLPGPKMLAYYSARFTTVEINNTFYRMPTSKLIAGWANEVPAGFTFAVKAPQRITHQLRLKDASDPTEAFLRFTGELGPSLGPLLFQLPPYQKKDADRLKGFLALLRELDANRRVAFEFRHASWFDDEVYALLREHGAALCTAEGEDVTAPFTPTARWGYVRLRKPEYNADDLTRWSERILSQDWDEAFVYLKHEDEGKGPKFAEDLRGRLGAAAVVP